MPFEDGVLLRNLRLDRDGFLIQIEVGDTVDQLEIFKLHGGRLSALGGDQFVDSRA
jgi:O-succinylbenzoate synthase